METNYTNPDLPKSLAKSGKNIVVTLLGVSVITGFMPVFGLSSGYAEYIRYQDKKTTEVQEITSNLEGKKLILQGNSLLPITNPVIEGNKIKGQITVVITAYSSTVSQTDDDPFTTASGSTVRDGIIANNGLKFGTKIRIPELYGDKVFTVEDRMHSRKPDNQIDVWFPSYWEAKNFGIKKTYVEIL